MGYNTRMGNSADTCLTRHFYESVCGGRAVSGDMLRTASDLAQREPMRLETALRIVTGQTRPAYGTPYTVTKRARRPTSPDEF